MLIPIAKHRPTGRLVGPLQVARGVACDCLCLECGLPLIAKQGPVVSWHFSHTGNGTEETGSCGEGSIHKAAKAVLQSSRGRWMKLPKRIPEQPLLRIAQAQQEFRLTDIGRRVDLLITYDANTDQRGIQGHKRRRGDKTMACGGRNQRLSPEGQWIHRRPGADKSILH